MSYRLVASYSLHEHRCATATPDGTQVGTGNIQNFALLLVSVILTTSIFFFVQIITRVGNITFNEI